MSTNKELYERWMNAKFPHRRKMHIGITPIDINLFFAQDDDERYLAQLHYSKQYDTHGYPQMRKEFLDFLEASLDQKRTLAHRNGFTSLPALLFALHVLEDNFPDTWFVYAAAVLDGRPILDIAEVEAIRIVKVLKMVDHGRRVVEKAYELGLYRMSKGIPLLTQGAE